MLALLELFVIVTSIVAAFNLELLVFFVALRFGHFHIL